MHLFSWRKQFLEASYLIYEFLVYPTSLVWMRPETSSSFPSQWSAASFTTRNWLLCFLKLPLSTTRNFSEWSVGCYKLDCCHCAACCINTLKVDHLWNENVSTFLKCIEDVFRSSISLCSELRKIRLTFIPHGIPNVTFIISNSPMKVLPI